MEIKKGTKLRVTHTRKGTFTGVAFEDFDTNDEFYRITVDDKQQTVMGLTTDWCVGERIPCRASLTQITVI